MTHKKTTKGTHREKQRDTQEWLAVVSVKQQYHIRRRKNKNTHRYQKQYVNLNNKKATVFNKNWAT